MKRFVIHVLIYQLQPLKEPEIASPRLLLRIQRRLIEEKYQKQPNYQKRNYKEELEIVKDSLIVNGYLG
ncbi:hypothetical protein Glove_417g35 [Diversispora epigaea]|uniref:Uncharacterized protein n=1 Tax=Diversispora epigaea TaxID=1348612 RepID=A0A397GX98_9GLOM|nr:hypothetical protein Glove_417g35 [Diversispora epigaea]